MMEMVEVRTVISSISQKSFDLSGLSLRLRAISRDP